MPSPSDRRRRSPALGKLVLGVLGLALSLAATARLSWVSTADAAATLDGGPRPSPAAGPADRVAAGSEGGAPARASVVEWSRTNGADGAHAAALADITPANVAGLSIAWTYRTGDVSDGSGGTAATAFQATPIMVDGALYFTTPWSRVIALDAESGEERWTFDPGLDRSDRHYKMVTSRGVATWLDPERGDGEPCRRRILAPVFDARLLALDAATGAPCRDFGAAGQIDLGLGVPRIEGRRHNYFLTSAPTVVHDLVVVGSMVNDNVVADAPSGVVRAFHARTGELVWSFEPLAGVGARASDGAWVPAGAANTWVSMTPDEERDLLFVPTGSASPDHWGGLRPGANGYANSLVALRASTGEVVWHDQIVRHDLWDYDLATPPALVTITRGGRRIPAVVQATKMGYLFVFDRETGAPLFPILERPVPASDVPGERVSPTQRVPLLPPPLTPQGLRPEDAWGLTPLDRLACRRRIARLRHDGVYAPPSVRGTVSMPGFLGGMEWGGVAIDPASGLLVTNLNHLAMVATLIPRDDVAQALAHPDDRSMVARQEGTPFGVRREPLLSPLGVPCNPPPWGTLAAVDLASGRVRWHVPFGTMRDLLGVPTPKAWGSPSLGGPVVAGGLAFIGGTMDRRLRAFEVATGRLVWETELPASAQATPMTYRARPGGRQYVVVAAGGHAGMRTRLGDHLIAFALTGAPAVEGGR